MRGIERQVSHTVSLHVDIPSSVQTDAQWCSAFCTSQNQKDELLPFRSTCGLSPESLHVSANRHDCSSTNNLCPLPPFSDGDERVLSMCESPLDPPPEEQVDDHLPVQHTPTSSRDECECRTPLQSWSSNRPSTCQFRGQAALPLLFFRQRSRRRLVCLNDSAIDRK